MFSRGWTVGIVVCLLANAASGQRFIKVTPTEVKGKITRVGPGMLAIDTGANQRWTVSVPNGTDIKVKGTAELEALVPGVFVRFVAAMDKRQSRSHEKVSGLDIFTPGKGPERQLGVQRTDEVRAAPGGGGADPFGGANPAAKASRKPAGKAGGGPQVESFEIHGQVAGYRAGKLTVVVPQNQYFKPKLTIELSDDATINVALSDLAAVKPGDTARALVISKVAGQGEALEVEVELAAPLGAGSKKVKKPGAKQPAGERPGKDAAAPREPGRAGPKPKAAADDEGEAAEAPAPQAANAVPAEKARKIQQGLKLKPEEFQGKQELQLSFDGAGNPLTFVPCRAVTKKTITDHFGEPERKTAVNGMLPVGEGGKQIEVQWELWDYGPLRILFDAWGKAQYYATK